MRISRFIVVAFALLAGVAGCVTCGDHREPSKHYIPAGYVGWVRVEYGVAGAPSIPSDWFGPWEHFTYPPSGLLQTSSYLYQGGATMEFYYYSDDHLTPLPENMNHGGVISWCVRRPDGSRLEREFLTFFIGAKEVYEKHKHELEQLRKGDCEYVIKSLDDLPKVRNISADLNDALAGLKDFGRH
ncbi:MAG TPA: hypothetical protein VN256_17150 [Pyrinomonadaceae bacterium]|nr:hypothetical protein [Pyrinomonadaceae bacterium]